MLKLKSKRVIALENYVAALEKENELFCDKLTKSDAEKKELAFKVEILSAGNKNLEKEIASLNEELSALNEEKAALLASIEELKEKRTVSQMTTDEEKPVTQAQILDEYLNGVDEQ